MFHQKQLSFFLALFVFPYMSWLSAQESGVHLSAYYYPWYDTTGRHWSQGYFGKTSGQGPALGEYSSRDPEAIVQHVKWSHQMGIDNWVCAWWGRGEWEDVTLKYRVAPILDQVKNGESKPPVTFCVFYESEGLLGLDPQKGIEFTIKNTRKLESDFDYLADTYFSHPSYYKIDGRPVIYLYLSRTFTGDYSKAIKNVRAAAKQKGFDLYLVGDEVYWGAPDVDRIKELDAITAYNMHGPPPELKVPGDWTSFIDKVGEVYRRYQAAADKLGVAFIPGIMPGFNSHGADPTREHYIIPREFSTASGGKSTLDEFIKVAKDTLGKKLLSVTITSFNEWHEGTQLEPGPDGKTLYPNLFQLSNP